MWRCLRQQTNHKHNNSFEQWRKFSKERGRRWREGGKEGASEGGGDYARKGHFRIDAYTALLYILYGVHAGEHFTRLPCVLFNPAVVRHCLVNLSLLLLYLWSWIALSAVWEWSGVSELIGHSCPSSPVHIFPSGIYLHTCTEKKRIPSIDMKSRSPGVANPMSRPSSL